MSKFKTFAAILLAAHGGFSCGHFATRYKIHRDLLAAELAHYDARNGSIVYGPPPPALAAAEILQDFVSQSPPVAKKPHAIKKVEKKPDGIRIAAPPPPLRNYVYSPSAAAGGKK